LPTAAPRPAPAPARPAPTPTPPPRPRPAAAASPARGIALAAGLLALLGVGGFFAWRWLRPTRTALVTTTPAPPPTTLPAATLPVAPPEATLPVATAPTPEAPVEEVVTIVKPPSPKAPSPSPSAGKPSPSPKGAATPAPVATPAGPSPEELRAQQIAAEVAGLLGQAEAASAAARHDEALRLYDEALKLDPQNARAVAGRAPAQGAVSASRRRFAPGRTSVQSGRSKGGDLSGFDSSDVQVLDAPGQILFEVAPASVKPGDSFSVKIFFQNDAKKALRVKSLSVGTMANGARSGGPVTPRAREVAPQQRALVEELSGVWKDGTSTWTVEVVLVSDRNDTYRNQVSWK